MSKKFFKKTLKESIIGPVSVVYSTENGFLVEEIFLSDKYLLSEEKLEEKYGLIEEKGSKNINKFLSKIDSYLNGENIHFSIDYLNFNKLTDFQKKVLKAQMETPKGKVNSYKDLAIRINKPKAYRAVANALANNPFPIIIPCHRTIKKDNRIGGFNGYKFGIESKEILLDLENIEIKHNKVLSNSRHISNNKNFQTKLNNYR